MTASLRLVLTTLGVAVLIGLTAAWSAAPASAAPAQGSLLVTTTGVAKGQPVKVVISRKGQRTRVVRGRRTLLRGLRAGRWTVRVLPVTTRRRVGVVPRGARVLPRRSRLSVTITAKRTKRLGIAYGSVINPKALAAPRALSVAGDPTLPSAVTVAAGSAPRAGSFILSGPTDQLPDGLVATVTKVSSGPGGSKTLALKNVPVTDAVPVIAYSGPILGQRPQIMDLGTLVDLKLSGSDCGVTGGYEVGGGFSLSSPSLEADINAGVFGVGARANLVVRARPRVSASFTTSAGVFCEKELAAPTKILGYITVGPVPIPVYAAIPLKMRAQSTAQMALTASVAWNMAVGVRTQGTRVVPVFEANSPQTDINVSADSPTTIGPSVGLEVGLGVRKLASVNVSASTAVEFTAASRQCSWDWKLGDLQGAVAVGPLTVKTPTAFTMNHRLWTGCGASTFAPPSAGTPPATGPIPGMPRLGYGPIPSRPPNFHVGPSNCSPRFYEITWSEWGPTQAVGTGTLYYWPPTSTSCFNPPTEVPGTTITLSEPQVCGSQGVVYTAVGWASSQYSDVWRDLCIP